MYPPDRAVSLTLKAREMVELRIKEINAAYAKLKRKIR